MLTDTDVEVRIQLATEAYFKVSSSLYRRTSKPYTTEAISKIIREALHGLPEDAKIHHRLLMVRQDIIQGTSKRSA